jgi:hypothetical protein
VVANKGFLKRLANSAKFAVYLPVLVAFSLEHMARRLNNWTYRDITEFLKENGFTFFLPLKGSHESWIKLEENGEPDRIVEVNITHSSYPPKTLRIFIRHSGIARDEWIKWAGS